MNLLKKLLHQGKAVIAWFLRLSLFKKALVVAVILLAGWFIAGQISKGSATPQYQTAAVERGTLISSVTSSGTVTSGNKASIQTQATGIVSEVYVKNGETVTQGQNIAALTLDSTSAQKQAAA